MLGGRSEERPYNLLIICVLPFLSRSDNTVYYPRTTVRGKVATPPISVADAAALHHISTLDV